MQTIATWAGWIAGIIACITAIVVPIRNAVKALQTPIADIRAENARQTEQLNGLSDSVARLSGDRLNQAYDYYTGRGWCPASKKRELEDWYNAYKKAGYNHLADHYLDALIALPEHPTMEVR